MSDYIPKQASIHSFVQVKDLTRSHKDSFSLPGFSDNSKKGKILIIRANNEYMSVE